MLEFVDSNLLFSLTILLFVSWNLQEPFYFSSSCILKFMNFITALNIIIFFFHLFTFFSIDIDRILYVHKNCSTAKRIPQKDTKFNICAKYDGFRRTIPYCALYNGR